MYIYIYLFLHINCIYLHILCIFLHICTHFHISQFRSQRLIFLQSYILYDQNIAQEFTFNHRRPSPSPLSRVPRLRITGPTVKVCSLSLHAERVASSVPRWNPWELGQDVCDGQNLQHLLVALELIDHRRIHPINTTSRQKYAEYAEYAYYQKVCRYTQPGRLLP